MSWYEDFCNDTQNWDEEGFMEFPYPIAFLYRSLRNMLSTGDMIGCLLRLKDIFDVTIRHLVLFAAAIELNNGDEQIVKLMCKPNKSLSFGDWVNDLTKAARELPCISDGSQPDLLAALVKANRFYNEKQIVKWRNDEIAHNIMPNTASTVFIENLRQKIIEVAEFFTKNHTLIQALQLYQNGHPLVGDNCQVDDSPLFIQTNGKLVPTEPVIVPYKKSIAYFESIDPRNVCRYIDYISEGRYIASDDYFRNIRRKHYSALSVTDNSDATTPVYVSSVDKALESFGKAEDYVKATYYLDWLKAAMGKNGKGIYMMCAERGTGKTAFTYAIDELGGDNMHIEGCTVRSYYINRTNIRSAMDFSTSVSRLFTKTKTDRLESSSDMHLPRITIASCNPAEDMAYLLNTYRRYHDKLFSQDRLLLVIDGIDELQADNAGILNFLPHPSMLDEGVHILLTCRSDGAMPAYVLSFVQTFQFTEMKIFNRKVENRELLRQYVNSKIRVKGCKLKENEIEKLMGILHDSFSNAQLLKQFLEYGSYDDLDAIKHQSVLDFYYDYLKRLYGETVFKKVLKLLCTLATLYEPVDIHELIWLADGVNDASDITVSDIAMLYDLKCLISVERSYQGNLYYMGNKQSTEYVVTNFFVELKSQVQEWVAYIKAAELEEGGVFNPISYLLAYLYHYCKEYGDIKWIDDKMIEKMNNYAVRLARISNYEHSIHRVINIYLSVATIHKARHYKEPHEIKHMTGYIVACRNVIHSYYKIKQYQLAIDMGNEVIRFCEGFDTEVRKRKDITQILSITYSDMSAVYGSINDYKTSEKFYLKAKELAEKVNDTAVLRTLKMNALNIYKVLDPAKAVGSATSIIENEESCYSKAEIASAHLWRGVAKRRLGATKEEDYKDYNEAIKIIETLHASTKPPAPSVEPLEGKIVPHNFELEFGVYIHALFFRGQCYNRQEGDIEKAIRDFRQALQSLAILEMKGVNTDLFLKPRILTQLALAFSHRHFINKKNDDKEQALGCIQAAELIWSQLKEAGIMIDRLSAINTYHNHGLILSNVGQIKDGIAKLIDTTKIFMPQDDRELSEIKRIYDSISSLYNEIDDKNNADLYSAKKDEVTIVKVKNE
ncbi:MAG: hypothetical protein C4554_07725 [Dethiobacter sp.]|nr:MAG: hypothetical protein C4554_07725 [Dethiobacter sp.]